MVLETIGLKLVTLDQNQGIGKTVLPPEALGENPFLASSGLWWLPAFPELWQHPSNLFLHGHSDSFSSVVSFPSASLLLRPLWWCLGHKIIWDNLHNTILNLITSSKSPLFKYGSRYWNVDVFWGAVFQPTINTIMFILFYKERNRSPKR